MLVLYMGFTISVMGQYLNRLVSTGIITLSHATVHVHLNLFRCSLRVPPMNVSVCVINFVAQKGESLTASLFAP